MARMIVTAFFVLVYCGCESTRRHSTDLEALPTAQAPANALAGESDGNEYLVYLGTWYTLEESPGIYAYRFNTTTGELLSLGVAAKTPNSDFLAVHPNGRFIYATCEKLGTVAASAIDKSTGKLTFLNKIDAGGADPTHIDIDLTGRAVGVANYTGGSVSVLSINEDGRLHEISAIVHHTGSSINPERQQGPHPHSVNFSPDNRFVVAVDLGADKLFIYRYDATVGSLVANDLTSVTVNPGAGPRHFSFHPTGRFAYVINEFDSTVTVFSYDAQHGALEELQTISTLPKGFTGTNFCAEVSVHPSGRFLYGSNRGHNSIVVFSIDSDKGTLTLVEIVSSQGKWPRNFRIDPTGRYLVNANRDSNNVIVFHIDQGSGRLTPTGQVLEIESPVCVRFVPLD